MTVMPSLIRLWVRLLGAGFFFSRWFELMGGKVLLASLRADAILEVALMKGPVRCEFGAHELHALITGQAGCFPEGLSAQLQGQGRIPS